jgi:uncharacterized NAD-dependent epimerase/dehydratase family protein
MNSLLEGNAIVYCEGMFNTSNGKTAHGLVRFTHRYKVLCVVDSRHAGQDAGDVLDGKANNLPIYGSVDHAIEATGTGDNPPTHFVVGLAPDGGRLNARAREDVRKALASGLNVDCGLHDFLSEDPEMKRLAAEGGGKIRDIRKPPAVDQLHFFTGKIKEVQALKIAVLGTDSAVGKRTTAWLIVKGFQQRDVQAELIGTGQTAWMQGARYCIIMDSLINDFVSGEIEHVVWSAWNDQKPDVIVLEGQGSLMNPAYPGGFEILAAGRPDIVILQHAPARKEYDGFPGYRIQPLAQQIEAIQLISGKQVVAVTVNHEALPGDQIPLVCNAIEQAVGLPAFDVLRDGTDPLVDLLATYLENRKKACRIK